MTVKREKTDPVLGLEIRQYLQSLGIETPIVNSNLFQPTESKIAKIEKSLTNIWEVLGMDLKDDSLAETPKRIARMLVNELNWGLLSENFPKCTVVDNKMGYDEMVVEKGITVMSTCEHHGVVFTGHAVVGYIPHEKVLGLSKINRIVEYFSRRPQIQERLTEQIHHALAYILDTNDIAVTIDAVHYCVKSRGVSDQSSSTVTSKLGGRFKTESSMRNEFLSLAKYKS